MNKTQLVDALAARIGDRPAAAIAVDGLLETIVDTVRSGEVVSIAGFGVFEGRSRAARLARNPRTGEAVDVPAATVPAFRPGVGFRAAVNGGSAAPTAPALSEKPPAQPAPAPIAPEEMAPEEMAAAEKAPRAAKPAKSGKVTVSASFAADGPKPDKAKGGKRKKGKGKR